MGREDISRFVENREPYILRGEVENWDNLLAIFGEPDNPDELDLDENQNIPHGVRPHGSWDRRVRGLYGKQNPERLSIPPTPTDAESGNAWPLPWRITNAVSAYCLSHFGWGLDNELIRIAQDVKSTRDSQVISLGQWNERLHKLEFTQHLLSLPYDLKGTSESFMSLDFSKATITSQHSSSANSMKNGLIEWLEDRHGTAPTAFDLSTLKPEVNSYSLDEYSDNNKVWTLPETHSMQKTSRAVLNRGLIEAMWPGTVQRLGEVSTLFVPYHDQQTRWLWLTGWMSMFLVGYLARSRLEPELHRFYRDQIRKEFLHGWLGDHEAGPKDGIGEKQLSEIAPWHSGLPYPLVLAAAMIPRFGKAGYSVARRPFLFAPKYCGIPSKTDSDERAWIVTAQDVQATRHGEPLTFDDAITDSGAAVTPLMTDNPMLSVLLDAFGVSLGQTIRAASGKNNVGTKWILRFSIISVGLILSFVLKFSFVISFLASCCIAAALKLVLEHRANITWTRDNLFGDDDSTPEPNLDTGLFIADGGFYDYLGVTELLRRKCDLILVSDAGCNDGSEMLQVLARMCERATSEMGIRFLDLDHDSPIDFGRLERNEQRLAHQPFICMRVRYEGADEDSLLIYSQMAITDGDPIEIRQIRNRFPKFPDEPTLNQFYTEDQVSAYQLLGYHIGKRVCSELERWAPDCAKAAHRQLETTKQEAGLPFRQPALEVIKHRLLTSYKLACHEELSHQHDDILSEAVWQAKFAAFPTLEPSLQELYDRPKLEPIDFWITKYQANADVRAAYRDAVIRDTNRLDGNLDSVCYATFTRVAFGDPKKLLDADKEFDADKVFTLDLNACHLAAVAIACQEIHRGRPHATFQVGGREKLLTLVKSIAGELETLIRTDGPKKMSDFEHGDVGLGHPDMGVSPREIAAMATQERVSPPMPGLANQAADRVTIDIVSKLISEILELEKSVFQGSERATTVSFAQCCIGLCARIARSRLSPPTDFVVAVSRHWYQQYQDLGQESVPIEFRAKVERAIRRTDPVALQRELRKYWYANFLQQKEIKHTREQLAVETRQAEMDAAQKRREARNLLEGDDGTRRS